MARALLLALALLTLSAGAAGAPQAPPSGRLASHLFLAAGESRSLAGLGTLLETVHLTSPPAVTVRKGAVQARAGGSSCLRFRYRRERDENGVQTLCVVVFDETGDCTGETRLSLDLERFVPPSRRGSANLLEAGEGLFYAACRTAAGRYRLQRPERELPPLYLTVVDALGGGAYSLGGSEPARLRRSTIATYSGEALRPPWIVPLSRELDRLELTAAAKLELGGDRCSPPRCLPRRGLVRPGDVVLVGYYLPEALHREAVSATPEAVLDRFFRERAGIGWDEVAAVTDDARERAFARLVSLEAMGETLELFDELFGLREKRVAVAFLPHWFATYELTHLCFPSEEEQERCRRVEAAVAAEEARRVADWRRAGFRLWYGGGLEYREGGEYVAFARRRPHFSLFEGIVAGVAANGSVRVPDVPATLRNAVSELARETAGETPVLLYLSGPPIEAATGGPPCEADICAADFRAAFEQGEAVLDAALAALSPGQLRGFGVALFDGSHFDLRRPHERFAFFALNRVGETGYNSPILNVYRAR